MDNNTRFALSLKALAHLIRKSDYDFAISHVLDDYEFDEEDVNIISNKVYGWIDRLNKEADGLLEDNDD